MENDIFQDVRNAVGCNIISDIKTDRYRSKSVDFLICADFDKYSLSSISDIAEYIFQAECNFKTESDAKDFFLNRKMAVH